MGQAAYNMVRIQRSNAAKILDGLRAALEDENRPSEIAVLKDAIKIADDLCEKLFHAAVVTNPNG